MYPPCDPGESLALVRAADLGLTNIVMLLHTSGCSVHAQNDMAFRLAEGRHPETLEYLNLCAHDRERPRRRPPQPPPAP